MHTYKMLSDADELERVLLPVLVQNGFEIPQRGCYVAAVEFDEEGQVVAYQMLQNAIFFEGLWARNHSAHLLTLYRMGLEYAEKLSLGKPMTFTRADEAGTRIGKLAEALGFKRKLWNVYRKER